MSDRPYLSLGAQELEATAKASWGSVSALQGILGELRFRTTAKAQRLEREVAGRVLALGGTLASDARQRSESQFKQQPQPKQDAPDPRINELSLRALAAEQRARELQERLSAAEAQMARSGTTTELERLYARVWLTPGCPDYVLKATMRAFRKENHPDSLSDRPKEEHLAAQTRFQDTEQVFDRIQHSRKSK